MESESNNEDVMNVCRLCLGTDNLMSIFGDSIQIPENLKDVIYITTGVTISPSDEISQKLCYKCVNITVRMFKFRSSSIVNDLELKEKAAVKKLRLGWHKSVQSLLKQYPNVVLPSSVTGLNIAPIVMVDRNGIDHWKFQDRKRKELQKMKDKEAVLQNDEELKRDLEKDITPHIIPNKELLSEELLNYELQAEMNFVEIDASPLNSESTEAIPDKEMSTERRSQKSNSDHEDLEGVVIERLKSTPIENGRKRKPSPSLNKHDTKKVKFNSNPHETEDAENSLLDLKYVNECIYLCDICNNILYNLKDLKKHKNKHMRCTLCKKNFRSLRETEEHSERHCPIKQMMNNLPTVLLRRCDKSDEIRKQYPKAFGLASREDLRNQPVVNYGKKGGADKQQTEEISLISDDEDINTSTSNSELPSVNSANNTSAGTSIPAADKEIAPSLSTGREKRDSVISSHACKHDLGITGDNVLNLNLDDDEIALVQNILKRSNGKIKDFSMQTDLPNNCDIIVSLNKDKLFELKGLREFLNYYKIPVNVSYATQYTAKYGNDPSLFSKYHHFEWSVIKTKKKPLVPSAIEKVKISQNNTTTITNETTKSGAPAYTMPPLIFIKPQPQLASQTLYTIPVQNTQRNTCSTITPNFSVKQVECTPQIDKSSILSVTSKEKSDGTFRNNIDVDEFTALFSNVGHPINSNDQNKNLVNANRSQNRTNNDQKKISVHENTSVQEIASISNTFNIQNDPSSASALSKAWAVIPNCVGKTQMKSKTNYNTTTKTNSIPNSTFTNMFTKEVPKERTAVAMPQLSSNNVISNNTEHKNLLNGNKFVFTNSTTQASFNISCLSLNNNPVNGKSTNATSIPQQYAMAGRKTGVVNSNSTNVQKNGSYLVTSFGSKNSIMTNATITSGTPSMPQANFMNVSVACSYNSGNSCLNTAGNTIANIYSRNNMFSTKNSCSNKSAQEMILLNSISNPNNHSRTTASSLYLSNKPKDNTVLPQMKDLSVPSSSVSVNNCMPPPPPPVIASLQSAGRTNTLNTSAKAMNQNESQSSSTTKSSSQWNGNQQFPMIRVKSFSELR